MRKEFAPDERSKRGTRRAVPFYAHAKGLGAGKSFSHVFLLRIGSTSRVDVEQVENFNEQLSANDYRSSIFRSNG